MLGLLIRAWRWRLLAAAATTVASLAWGLLFYIRDEIPATVPVLAGLTVWFLAEGKALYTRTP
jgi:hypothetical protein